MKSSILIASYLWRDTWSRWLEQPSSLLARFFVGLLLAMVATIILVALTLLERSLRERLESFGLNTLVVREMLSSTDPELMPNLDRPDRLQPLDDAGQRLRVRQLHSRARTELQSDVQVLSYPPESLPILAPFLGPDDTVIYFHEKLPEHLSVRFSLNRQSGQAVVRRPSDFFRPLGMEQVILVPQGWAAESERLGFVETTLFHRARNGAPMKHYVDSVRQLYTLDKRNPPQVQSALPLINELENLQERQKHWRLLLAGILGLAVALVYGAISVLEFRQNLYISALLRSLGAPGRFLYLRQWIENAFLANLAALSAVLLVALFHHDIFGALGFSKNLLDLTQSNPYLSREIGLILLWVNFGAFLSSLPVAVGLRRPVGKILN